MARRKSAFLVLFLKEASARGSNGGPARYSRTLSRSHGGGEHNGRGAEISKDLMRSLSIGDVEIVGRQNL